MPSLSSRMGRPGRERKRANAPKRDVSFAPDSVAKVFLSHPFQIFRAVRAAMNVDVGDHFIL